MGRYKWSYKSPNLIWAIGIVLLLITPLVTHEPPSRLGGFRLYPKAPKRGRASWVRAWGGHCRTVGGLSK